MTYDGWQAMVFGIRSNKQNGESGSVDLCAGYHIELLKHAFFMKCVYWGRLVENLFCVVSIENDCPDQDCLSRVLVITRFIICVERFEHLMRSQ